MQLIPDNLSIDFVGKRKLFLTLSGLVCLAILVGIAVFGFNWGVDFAGGSEIEVKFAGKVEASDIRKTMEAAGFEDALVQEIGAADEHSFLIRVGRVALMTDGDAAKAKAALQSKLGDQMVDLTFNPNYGDQFQLSLQKGTTPPAPEQVRQAIETTGLHVNRIDGHSSGYTIMMSGISEKVSSALKDAKGTIGMPDAELRRVEFVGPQVGRELRNQGILSVLIAALFILGYIALRFDTRFAPGAVVALFHDVIIVAGYYLVTRREFNLTSVAVLLTIVGYSVNDTIVIYDRIRENLQKKTGMGLAALTNLSINETLSRTILTGTTSMLAVTGLLIFGVGQIWDFAAAMVLGVLVGTYSSIYIASPTTIWLEEVFAKRRGNTPEAKPAASA
ncbi:MAG: protein translocase subunit SecF [Myxococcales bacterium]|jgi:preprotein translocase subunit SecF